MAFTRSFFAREDSGTANNPAVNLTGASALELSFVAEDASGNPGDLFFDQPTGGGIDPDTQVEIGGTSYSFTYELIGTLPTQNKHGANQVPAEFRGSEMVVVTIQDYPSSGETTRFAFMPNESATAADMDDFGNGRISLQNVDETPPPTPVCFADGTAILTPRGPMPVEDLEVGDLIVTMDRGHQPIKWISRTKLAWPGADEKAKPILISAGALGHRLPERDLLVSPQHRILLSGAAMTGSMTHSDVLAAAKGLVQMRGIRCKRGVKSVTYHHVLLDHHAIISAEGLATESFFPGRNAMAMLNRWQRSDIYRLFPGLRSDPTIGYGPIARPCVTVRRALALTIGRENRVFGRATRDLVDSTPASHLADLPT